MKRNGSVSRGWLEAQMIRRRPRVEGAREGEILDATLAMLVEAGYDRLTMDAVARRAKASKATLYRRWTSKPSLVVDALLRSKRSRELTAADTGSLRGDLIATFCGPGGMSEADNARVLAAVMTALHTDAEFADEFRERYLAPKIAVSQAIYARAQERGEIRADVDLTLIGPALAGILLHRTFLLREVVDATTIESVVDQIILPAATGRPYSPEGTA
jgi:AcrR family transcriptional regulator